MHIQALSYIAIMVLFFFSTPAQSQTAVKQKRGNPAKVDSTARVGNMKFIYYEDNTFEVIEILQEPTDMSSINADDFKKTTLESKPEVSDFINNLKMSQKKKANQAPNLRQSENGENPLVEEQIFRLQQIQLRLNK